MDAKKSIPASETSTQVSSLKASKRGLLNEATHGFEVRCSEYAFLKGTEKPPYYITVWKKDNPQNA